MVNILFKKSYQHKPFQNIPFDDLWNKKGIFTTIRVVGKPRRFLFMEEHLNNLNQSLKTLSIDIQIDKFFLNNIVYKLFKNNIYYDHLFRIAVTNKKISLSLRKRCKIKKKFKGILFEAEGSSVSNDLDTRIYSSNAFKNHNLNNLFLTKK